MSVAHPLWVVAALVAAAAYLWLTLRGLRRGAASALAYSDLAFFEAATGAGRDPGIAIAAAGALALGLVGTALAGPRITLALPAHGAVVLCVDTSGSMRAEDVAPSRADAASAAVRAFVDAVPDGTAIGLVTFAGSAIVVAPLTTDKDELRDAIARIPPPDGGTAIGDALDAAARLLPGSGRRAIVLITDGVNNAGADPLAVAPAIGAGGVEIDTVGIGTNGSDQLIPGTGELASLDEDALRAIASAAHGDYARAADAGNLRSRLRDLAANTTTQARHIDLAFPLAAAGGLVLILAVGAGMLAGRFP